VAEKPIEWSTVPKEPATTGFSDTYLPISRLYTGSRQREQTTWQFLYNVEGGAVPSPTGYSDDDLNKRFADSIQAIWGVYSADISKAVRAAQQKGLANILKAVLSPTTEKKAKRGSLDPKQAYQRVSSFLAREKGFSNILGSEEQFTRKYSRDQNSRNVVRDIEEVETSIEKATAPREELRKLINSIFIGGKEVVFSDKAIEVRVEDNKSIGLPLLSSGEKQLLFILVEALVAGPNTILIDEPEISMHVDWQKNLVRTIRTINPELQIIMATHSPEIMADVPDSCVFRL
jgi:hypothetical protein